MLERKTGQTRFQTLEEVTITPDLSGYYSVLHLAQHNATVYMGARSKTRAENAIDSIREIVPNAGIRPLAMDHMSFKYVVAAAKILTSKEEALHGVINNTGTMAVPWETSKDCYESQWQTNYLSRWLLTYHLLPTLPRTAK